MTWKKTIRICRFFFSRAAGIRDPKWPALLDSFYSITWLAAGWLLPGSWLGSQPAIEQRLAGAACLATKKGEKPRASQLLAAVS